MSMQNPFLSKGVGPQAPPPEIGTYRVITRHDGLWFRYWNGSTWMAGACTMVGAAKAIAPCQSPECFNEPWEPIAWNS